jgi:hypothetical protein
MADGEHRNISLAKIYLLLLLRIGFNQPHLIGWATNNLKTLGSQQRGDAVEQVDLAGIAADEYLGQLVVLPWLKI